MRADERREPGEIVRRKQPCGLFLIAVVIDAAGLVSEQLLCDRGFTHLPRTTEDDNLLFAKIGLDLGSNVSRYHNCIKCKDLNPYIIYNFGKSKVMLGIILINLPSVAVGSIFGTLQAFRLESPEKWTGCIVPPTGDKDGFEKRIFFGFYFGGPQ